MKVSFSRIIFLLYCVFWIIDLIHVIFLYYNGASERTLIYSFSLLIIGLTAIAIITFGRFISALTNLTNVLKNSNITLLKILLGEESEKNQ